MGHHGRIASRRLRVSVLAFVLLLGGCGEDERAQAPDEGADPKVATETIVLALYPYDTPSRLADRFHPLVEYLSRRLGREVSLYMAVSYEDQVRRIASGEADIAYMGPTPYLRARDRYNADSPAKVTPIVGEEEYHSVIVVRRDSGIETVADLKGRTVAFGSHRSFSSHYMPRAMLRRAGVSLLDLKDYSFLGRHERVALSVLHGDYDAGGVNRFVADKYLEQGAGLRVIDISPSLPPHAVVARPGLDLAIVTAVREALTNPDVEGARLLAAFEQPTPFVPVADCFFWPPFSGSVCG